MSQIVPPAPLLSSRPVSSRPVLTFREREKKRRETRVLHASISRLPLTGQQQTDTAEEGMGCWMCNNAQRTCAQEGVMD